MENETLARIVFIMAGGVLFVLYLLAIRWVVIKVMNMQSRDKRRMRDWNKNFNYLERRCEDLTATIDMLEKENIESRTMAVKFEYLIACLSVDRANWIKMGNDPKDYVPGPHLWGGFFYYLKLGSKDEKETKSNPFPDQSAQGE